MRVSFGEKSIIAPVKVKVKGKLSVVGCFDSVFCKHRAMELYWWKFEVLSNVSVFYVHGFFDFHALDKFGGVGGRGDS